MELTQKIDNYILAYIEGEELSEVSIDFMLENLPALERRKVFRTVAFDPAFSSVTLHDVVSSLDAPNTRRIVSASACIPASQHAAISYYHDMERHKHKGYPDFITYCVEGSVIATPEMISDAVVRGHKGMWRQNVLARVRREQEYIILREHQLVGSVVATLSGAVLSDRNNWPYPAEL